MILLETSQSHTKEMQARTSTISMEPGSFLAIHGKRCIVPDQLIGTLEEVHKVTREAQWEGIIAKCSDSIYLPERAAPAGSRSNICRRWRRSSSAGRPATVAAANPSAHCCSPNAATSAEPTSARSAPASVRPRCGT